jgi:hypothetical protein
LFRRSSFRQLEVKMIAGNATPGHGKDNARPAASGSICDSVTGSAIAHRSVEKTTTPGIIFFCKVFSKLVRIIIPGKKRHLPQHIENLMVLP